ncbi:DGQHR domain-containing protein [Paenibacillus sp. NPDC056722]|uniref:DGQHR domain-containing protein n=1 Tax=Paenibacillus sp. NPDC056722 TaxID=3345924 RepID=UPI003683FE74
MTFINELVSGTELKGTSRKRSQKYIFDKFELELQEKRESEGWLVDKYLKKHVKMKKEKPIDEQFEDEVWALLFSLGFSQMNKDRTLSIPYGAPGTGMRKQIDVFAVDDETVLFIECKCAQFGKKGDFKKEIEAIHGIREGLFAQTRKHFPGRKPKYILATKNYELSESDKKRLDGMNVHHFDERAIRYFTELAKHIGECARYQFLGNLFAGQKIVAMENRVPAIEGKMGNYTYYSFSIEPEKLLKIAYVLHRNEANSDMMPTYQRIIKKSRLKDIQNFVDKGGFFPNSLVISIDTKKPRFDLATPQIDTSISRIGILHLPQLYRSAYIIDGQHRLYGYANSKYANANSIPVVAFINLDQDKQVELFMEINENQKSVSRNLQNTLNADRLWTSEDWNKQRRALRLNIAQKLGELQSSPLYERITIGENEASPTKCITMETIESALKATNFFSRYSKGNIIDKNGTFDRGNNEATRKTLLPFLTRCFNYFKENLSEEWEANDVHGTVVSNNSIYAMIRIFNDIIDHLDAAKKLTPSNTDEITLADETEYYLAPLVNFFSKITEDERTEIRKHYGSGGKPKVWRTFQKVIAEARPDFQPEGLSQWIRDNTKQFNTDSFEMIQRLEYSIKHQIAGKLKEKFGDKWLTSGLPPKVYRQANNLMGKQNYENSSRGINKNVTIWDCVGIAHCRDITVFGSNWSDLFESTFTLPEDSKLSGGKTAKTEWILKLSTISNNKNSNVNYSVTEDEYLFLKNVSEWLGTLTM